MFKKAALHSLWVQCCKGEITSACTYSLVSLGVPIPYPAALGVPWGTPGRSGWIQAYFCVQSLGLIVWLTRDRTVALHSKNPCFFLFSRINLSAKCKPLCSHYCRPVGCHRYVQGSRFAVLKRQVWTPFWHLTVLLDFYFKYHCCYFLATTSWSKFNSCFKTQTKLQLHLHGLFLG